MTLIEMQAVLNDCQFQDYVLEIIESGGSNFLQAVYLEKDTVTGKLAKQTTRRWVLDLDITKDQLVATAFKCCLASTEHRCREWFLYKNRAIYQPHYPVDTLWNACEERTT